MKLYWVIVGVLIAFFLAIFWVFESLNIPIIKNPTPWLNQGGLIAAALGISLLTADVVLPIPSSLIMITNGLLFGVIVGTIVSMIGTLGAFWLGFGIGRHGGWLIWKTTSEDERNRAYRIMDRWGTLAIALTRPMPILAETTAIIAGALPIKWSKATFAAAIGSLPNALLYALTGAIASSFRNGILMAYFILFVGGIFWFLGYKSGKSE
ncbi:MAG: VTT domain-containing protein [Actinomycetota bacterium]|nr:VTT domain-containing protein [Actinomycetota bacterium]